MYRPQNATFILGLIEKDLKVNMFISFIDQSRIKVKIGCVQPWVGCWIAQCTRALRAFLPSFWRLFSLRFRRTEEYPSGLHHTNHSRGAISKLSWDSCIATRVDGRRLWQIVLLKQYHFYHQVLGSISTLPIDRLTVHHGAYHHHNYKIAR